MLSLPVVLALLAAPVAPVAPVAPATGESPDPVAAAPAPLPPTPSQRAEGVARFLAKELDLTPTQRTRVRRVVARELTMQEMARAQGLEVENVPPVRRERYVAADAEPLDPATLRRLRSADAILRQEARRKRAETWLAEQATRTQLDKNLHGLRVTALDSILRELHVGQIERYHDLLGDQGLEWLKTLVKQRSRKLPPLTAEQRREKQRADAWERQEKQRLAKEAAERKAQAKKKAQEEARRQRGRRGGRGGRARGGGRGRGRGRRR